MVDDPRQALHKELHELPDGWGWFWQDEVFDFQGGSQPPASTFLSEPRLGYVRLVQIRDYYTDSHLTFVPDSSRLKKCQSDDVMIARYGSSDDTLSENSLGRICRGIAGAYNVALAKAIPRSLVAKEFLYYLLKSDYFQQPLIAGGSRSVQAGFNRSSLATISLPVPPIPEQRVIAHIIGILDDKIELNRRMNETLEAIARALFKSWFIDFDPVHAKAEGRNLGLPADIVALFPDSFEGSDLGEIPKGWTAVPMGHLAEVTIGGDWGEDNPFANSIEAVCLRGVDLEHLRENGWADAPRRWFTTLSIQKRSLCARNVLVAGSGAGPTGRSLWAAPEVDQLWRVPVVYSNFCKRLRCPSEASAIYLDRSLSIMRDSGEIWDFVNGTSVPNLDMGALLSGKMIVLPDGPILDAFAKLTKRVSARLFSPESRTLATVRDTLLPKLLSGELRVNGISQLAGVYQ